MYLGIYAVILMTGILLLRRRKRIEIARDGKPSAAYKNSSAGFAALMAFCGLSAGIIQAGIYHEYLIFTEKRKETVVKEIGMCDSDDVLYQHFFMSFGAAGRHEPQSDAQMQNRTDDRTRNLLPRGTAGIHSGRRCV